MIRVRVRVRVLGLCYGFRTTAVERSVFLSYSAMNAEGRMTTPLHELEQRVR